MTPDAWSPGSHCVLVMVTLCSMDYIVHCDNCAADPS